ncbi:MAG: hypothetical protein ACSLFN_10315 [Candidatus Limnocylindrales bacterium]
MPTLTRKSFQLPELRLPEMRRDDIAKTLSDVRHELGEVRREIDKSRADIAKLHLPKFEMPDVDLSRLDVPKAVTSAAQSAGLMKRRRSRTPFVIGGLVTLALLIWAALRSPTVQERVKTVAKDARERIDAMRTPDDLEARAFDAADTMAVEGSPFSDAPIGAETPFDGPSDLPSGLGNNGAYGAADGTQELVDASRS